MIDQVKLQIIVETFAKYHIVIETQGMLVTAINGQPVNFDAKTYMQDQLIELICRVMANQLVEEVWQKQQDAK